MEAAGDYGERGQLNYSQVDSIMTTELSVSPTNSPAPEDGYDHLLQLINILGMLVLILIVVGPIVYVTFCCKRPLHGYDSPGASLRKCCRRLFTCYWIRKRCGCIEDPEVANDDADTNDYSRDPWLLPVDPPDYEVALTMPRVEDTIQGTPPPMYKELFKELMEKDAQEQSTSLGYMNRAFDMDQDTLRDIAFVIDNEPGDGSSVISSDRASFATSSFRRTNPRGFSSARSSRRSWRPRTNSSVSTTSQMEIENHRRVLRAKYSGLHRVASSVSGVSTCSVVVTDELPTYVEALEILRSRNTEDKTAVERL